MVVRNEMGRYLEESIGALHEFCDLIVCLDDGSTDGSLQWLREQPKVIASSTLDGPRSLAGGGDVRVRTFTHEAQTRQRLLAVTAMAIAGLPYEEAAILAIDADEFVADPDELVMSIDKADPSIKSWLLCMQEVWVASDEGLAVRIDGGWMEHDTAMLFRLPLEIESADWLFPNRALACGRVPPAVNRSRSEHSGTAVLHFGWAREAERAARHARYVEQDGGRFHASAHLDSIMWPKERVLVIDREWPDALSRRRERILELTSEGGNDVGEGDV